MTPQRRSPLGLALSATLLAWLAGCAAHRAPGLSGSAGSTLPAPARDPWPASGPVGGPQAHALVARGAILVDVRSEEAFAMERLPGALGLPLEDLDQATELFEDRAQPIVVYCGAGIQSAAAAKRLTAMGFTHVYDLGPMFGWRHAE